MIKGTFTVAIDGPAAAGKGTISRAVATHFGLAYLDTGLLYRAVGIIAAGGDPVAAAKELREQDLDRDDLRSAHAADAASKVAAIPDVRAALTDFQRAFAQREGGAVLDGRDIGTVICKGADVKLFITASAEVRARRRLAEMVAAGQETTFPQVLTDVVARDTRDAKRQTAPMTQAEDALLIDTTNMSIDAAVTEAVAKIKNVLEGRQ